MSQHLSGQESGREAEQRPRPSARATKSRLGREGREILTRTVERDVIPLLVAMPWMNASAATDDAAARSARDAAPSIDSSVLAWTVSLCLAPEGHGVAAYVTELHLRGIPAETLYIDLLAPVACELGEMWERDDCSIADVTLGIIRLQNAQRSLAPGFVGPAMPRIGAPRILLLPVPGEQHTFGLSMVMDFFMRAGWDARSDQVATAAQAIELVRHEQADLIGLSFACDDRIGTAERLISEFRRVSPNPNLVVMVGGPSFVADPGLAARVGADATAADGHQAVLLAHELVHAPHCVAGRS